MADDKDQSQKTEQPTERKLEEARKRGEVARAGEMRHASMFGGALIVTALMAGSFGATLLPLFTGLLGDAEHFRVDSSGDALHFAGGLAVRLGLAMAPVLAVLLIAALAGGLASGRPTLTWEHVRPKWSKLSPGAGFKRLFGSQGLVEFLKTMAKFSIVACIGVAIVLPNALRLEAVMTSGPEGILAMIGSLAVKLLLAITALVMVLAALDALWQRFSFMRRMQMSRQDIKDELKQSEGSPEIKAKLRANRMALARRRMMAAVPEATVVIMNPTHYAVALKYEHGAMAAPTCVAKGVDAVALRIRDVARTHGVVVLENPPLARALYASVEIDDPVPAEHYAAVAEVIGYVMRLSSGATPPPTRT